MRGPKIRCNVCNTEIASYYVHDFRTCNCPRTADGNGTQVYIDGGSDYTRIGNELNSDWVWVDKGPVDNAAKEIRKCAEEQFENPIGANAFEAIVSDIIWKHIGGEADKPPTPF